MEKLLYPKSKTERNHNMYCFLDPKQCVEILEQVGCSKAVIMHCKAVRDVALKIAVKAHADIILVETGALLHDIGRSKTHGIRHGIEGAIIAQQLGLPQNIKNIIERHLGAGIPKTEAVRFGLPPKDYIPQTLEEKIVCYADKLIKGKDRMNFREALKEIVDDLGPDHPAIQRFIDLHQSISRLTS